MRYLKILWQAVQSTFASPTQDPVRSALVLTLGLVLLLLVVVTLITVLEPKRRKVVKIRRFRVKPQSSLDDTGAETAADEGADNQVAVGAAASEGQLSSDVDRDEAEGDGREPSEEPKTGRRPLLSPRTARILGTWGVAVLMLVALLSAYYITSSDSYCATTCHVNLGTVAKAHELGHASCVSCHERRGVSAIVPNIARRVSMAIGQVLGATPSGAIVDSGACVACHRKDITRTTTSNDGLKMSHVEVEAAGLTCTSCHSVTGHSRARTYAMSSCIVCHDAKKAPAKCVTCHTQEPLAKGTTDATATLSSGKVLYPSVDVKPSCGGCHDQVKQCDSCHGLRMPHSDAFLKGGHAPIAAFEGKAKCWKCHSQGECTHCHVSFPGHGPDWKTAHKKESWSAPCPCHSHKSGRPACWECHSSQAPHTLLR